LGTVANGMPDGLGGRNGSPTLAGMYGLQARAPCPPAAGLDDTLQPWASLPLVQLEACGWALPFEDTFTENINTGWTPVVGQ
jgi:hypothetical protein